MKRRREDGFVMLLIIAALALIAVEIFVLTAGSNTILFQANDAYLEACERNLKVSGLAWAQRSIKSKGAETLDKSIELDISDMNIRGSALSVTIGQPENKQSHVQVITFCRRGRQRLQHSGRYRISHGP